MTVIHIVIKQCTCYWRQPGVTATYLKLLEHYWTIGIVDTNITVHIESIKCISFWLISMDGSNDVISVTYSIVYLLGSITAKQ